MQFAVSLSTETSSEKALAQALGDVQQQMQNAPVDLLLVFATQHHREAFRTFSQTLRKTLKPQCFLGCAAAGVIAADKEIEGRTSLGIWAAHLPGARISPFHLIYDQESEELRGWPKQMPAQDQAATFLMIADPFSTPANEILDMINTEYPGKAVLGGLASAGVAPGQNLFFWQDRIVEEGAIGAMITGAVSIATVVSQGCRPIGKPYIVTDANRNVIHTLGGSPALKIIQELFQSLPMVDQQLLSRGLHVGRAVDEMKSSFQRGDFIVRNILGMDERSGSIAIGDMIRKGQTVQFHVRDADSASQDLRELLEKQKPTNSPMGALVFSCNGRGVNMFGETNHDIRMIREVLDPAASIGFFAQGEIGPIGEKNFLHGFTASIGILKPPQPQTNRKGNQKHSHHNL